MRGSGARPLRRRWWVFGLAAAAAVAALATVSWVVLAHERFQVEQQALRQREVQLEAAAWRMQSALVPALASEWNRPESHWRAVLEDLPLVSGEGLPLPEGRALAPSPRIARPEAFFRFYFEWLPDGTWRSPHLPRPAIRPTVLARGWSTPEWLEEAEAWLDGLASSELDEDLRRFLEAGRNGSPPRTLLPKVVRPDAKGDFELALLRVAENPLRVQGLLLDWPLLRSRILASQAGLVADARLVGPGSELGASATRTRLALLPVEIELDAEPPAPPPFFATRALIGAAWLGTLIGLGALAVALGSTLRESVRRGRFASLVSHELRTPLTTFRMVSEMLARGMVPDEDARAEYLETLVKESERLERVVENVLQHTRIEQHRAALATERLGLRALVELVGQTLERRALSGGLLFELTDWRELPEDAQVAVDVAAIEQILGNLVDNAVKYAAESPAPIVRVVVTVDARTVRMRVEDEGPGVPTDRERRLFEPFVRDPQTQDRPGVGLGLSLARGLARDLGGDLRLLRDGRHRGATFELSLPLAKP